MIESAPSVGPKRFYAPDGKSLAFISDRSGREELYVTSADGVGDTQKLTRWNGGGNIEQELLAILVQREYQVWVPRGTEASGRPFAGYFGPKVVLQNWRSASNAEMFPAGFRALGLGKVIGTPTMGAVIGTGSYSLIDGSTVRTPGVGVYLADTKRTNMENYGVQPDIRVDNSPEDNLAGRDRQLETAVDELLRQLGSNKRNIASKEEQ